MAYRTKRKPTKKAEAAAVAEAINLTPTQHDTVTVRQPEAPPYTNAQPRLSAGTPRQSPTQGEPTP